MRERINGLGAWLSIACSVVTIGVVVARGGAMVSQQEDHGRRLATIEAGGSPAFRSHEAKDDQRVADLERRTAEVERQVQAILAAVQEIRGDVRELKADVRFLRQSTEKK